MAKNDRDYHMQRARTELDMAYRASRRDVAESHMRLSSLHMERLRALDAAGLRPGTHR